MTHPKTVCGALLALAVAIAPARANIRFNFVPDAGMNRTAILGFNRAASLWSSVLANNITINVQIGFTSLGPGIIGQTSTSWDERSYTEIKGALANNRVSSDDYSSFASLQPNDAYFRLINHTSNNPNGVNSDTPYVDSMNRVGITTANAKALGLLGPSSSIDAVIRFSSNFPFDFNHGTTIAPDKFDFVGAAAHELGHALGFISGVDDIDAANGAAPGTNFSSNMIDLFRYSEASLQAGPGYTDYTADTRSKYFSVNGGSSLTGAFATGPTFGDGRQASHWKDSLGLGIMDPTADFGERLDISFLDLKAFDVMGYTLVPEPAILVLLPFLAALCLVFRRVACLIPRR